MSFKLGHNRLPTSLKVKRGFASSGLMEYFLEFITKYYILTLLIWGFKVLMFFDGAILSMKYSIKVSTKRKISVYVLTPNGYLPSMK